MEIKISEIAEGRLTPEQAESLQQFFRKGGTWEELLKLTPEQVDEVYAVGYKHYEEKNYDQALASFSALIQLNPYNPKHWIAIGAALQGQQQYQDAISAYEIALVLDENHIPTLFYYAQCTFALDRRAETLDLLRKIVQQNSHDPLCEKAAMILNLMEQEGG